MKHAEQLCKCQRVDLGPTTEITLSAGEEAVSLELGLKTSKRLHSFFFFFVFGA